MNFALFKALRLLAWMTPSLIFASLPQALIDDSGSTNRPGMRITIDRSGHSVIDQGDQDAKHVRLPGSMCARFMKDVEGAKPLDILPKVRCIKSVSFGSSLFVEFEGARSPDLSCPATDDARSKQLRKDAEDILQAARQMTGARNRIGPITPVVRPPQ